MQEQKRSALRKLSENTVSASALVNQAPTSDTQPGRKKFTHCWNQNHTEPYCWKKYGRPTRPRKGGGKNDEEKNIPAAAAVAIETEQGSETENDPDYVSMMANDRVADSSL